MTGSATATVVVLAAIWAVSKILIAVDGFEATPRREYERSERSGITDTQFWRYAIVGDEVSEYRKDKREKQRKRQERKHG